MAVVTWAKLRKFVAVNLPKRRRMRERPSEAVLQDLELLLRIYDEEIEHMRAERLKRN